MSKEPNPIIRTLAVVIFCFVLGVLPVFASDVNRYRFVISWDSDAAAVYTTDEIKRVLSSRSDAIGGTAEFPSFDEKQQTLTVEVSCKCSIEIARSIFFNISLGLHHVVSKANPYPVDLYKSMDEAKQKAGDRQLVLPYRQDDATSDRFVIVVSEPIVTAEHISNSEPLMYMAARFVVGFEFNKNGAAAMEKWSGSNINNYLAVVLNGRVVSIAYIRSVISDKGEITGNFGEAEAKRIAGSLASGRLPGLDILSESLVSSVTPSPQSL